VQRNLVAWDAPHGAIHSLSHLSELSPVRSVLLCISERSFYVLQNLVAEDVAFRARYALEELDAGFVPVCDQDAEWDDYLAVVENLQLEVWDMSCDVTQALENILAQLENCCAVQSAILRSIATGANGPAMDSYLGDGHTYYDPPSNNTENPGGSALCQRAWSFALDWSEANSEARNQASALGQAGVALITVIFAAINLPLGVLVGLLLEIAEVIILIDADVYEETLADAAEDLACAIYTASTSAVAVSQARAVCGSLPGLNQRTKDALASQCCNSVMDAIFSGSYATRGDAPDNCSGCSAPSSDLVLTASTTPYNVILIGELVDYDDESAAWGWSSNSAGARLQIGFTPGTLVTDAKLTAYIGAQNPPSAISIAIYKVSPWTEIVKETGVTISESPPGTDPFIFEWPGVNLQAGISYQLHFSKWPSEINWTNRITLEAYTP